MTVKELYAQIEGDYEDASERLMNDELISKFVLKFLNDKSYADLKAAVANGDIDLSFRAAHTIKGVAANLGFTKLQMAASELTEQLRPQEAPADVDLVANVDETYEEVITAIEKYKNEK